MASSPSSSSSRSTMFYYGGFEDHRDEPHFLEACFLCRKPLGLNRDIFMYRGNTPFCSKECRQEQIEIDESNDKSWKVSSKRGVRQSESNQSSTTSKTVRTGTVAVA
ncbi:FCS-Like Zinc finger 3 [Prosopis cineraria]|uniref:FCS-Like Zinc finger 3 n=1 Tax=Prosopis cineraria TaxID=364024 RepID=UPI00240FF4B6|nr:FCS-Like Zinc finger 3 [Prosopis cineraria]